MANDSDKAEDGAAAGPEAVPDKANAKAELPQVDSPPLSPGEAAETADTEPAAEPVAAKTPQTAIALFAAPERVENPAAEPRRWSPRNTRAALLAASVALAAAVGALAGAVSSGNFAAPPPRQDAAAGEERQAMQKSLAHLSKEVAALKTNLEAANKAAHSQVAKISDKISERLATAGAEITGTISPPQTVAAVPMPRPAPRQDMLQEPKIAAVETQSPPRPVVVSDWIIREARDGYVYVQGHGEIYQVVPGAPLPGLGPVQTIAQRDGRWMVVTPRGIIVSMRDRGFFERF
jgi:hypothetical protein